MEWNQKLYSKTLKDNKELKNENMYLENEMTHERDLIYAL